MNTSEVFLIKKLWGENAAELSKSSKNIYNDFKKWINQTIVVSAIRSPDFNTTDCLIKIWDLLSYNWINTEEVFKIIEELENFHLDILEEKLVCEKENVINLIKKEFKEFKKKIKSYINNGNKKLIPDSRNDYSIDLEDWRIFPIIWFWEIISCKIYSSIIDTISETWICSKAIDLSRIVTSYELIWKNEREIFDILSEKIKDIVEENIEKNWIPVLSGYIWIFEKWIEKTIWRWYSDATAAITSVWLARSGVNVILEIQKSVKWLLSSDPRILDNPSDAVLIKKLNYLAAREITWDSWAQAKLLHYQTLRSEVQEAWIKIHLYDPFSEDSNWSWILDKEVECEINNWVEFIWWRKDMVFFSISSWKMFEKWILTRLFWIVDDYFSVDIVSASETEVTFTIDWKCSIDKELEEMTKEIKKEFNMSENTHMEFVEYRKEKSLIFCVGQHMRDRVWLIAKATKALWDNKINIEMISQWRLQRAIIFWIDSNDMRKAVNVLHNTFITK